MKFSMLNGAALGALLAMPLLANPALAKESAVESGWRQVAYSCESGQTLTVAYRESGSSARVTAPDKPVVSLVSRPAKSGFRYGAARYELRGEGDAVTWQTGSKTPVKCTTGSAAAGNMAADSR